MPTPAYLFAITAYTGEQRTAERIAHGPKGTRVLIDVIASYNLTDDINLVANYDYNSLSKASVPDGNMAKAVWHGFAGYVHYQYNKQWRITTRGEIFFDKNGFRTGIEQAWQEFTITLGFMPMKNFELRAETRYDYSNKKSFMKGNNNRVRDQQSYGIDGIYQF